MLLYQNLPDLPSCNVPTLEPFAGRVGTDCAIESFGMWVCEEQTYIHETAISLEVQNVGLISIGVYCDASPKY